MHSASAMTAPQPTAVGYGAPPPPNHTLPPGYVRKIPVSLSHGSPEATFTNLPPCSSRLLGPGLFDICHIIPHPFCILILLAHPSCVATCPHACCVADGNRCSTLLLASLTSSITPLKQPSGSVRAESVGFCRWRKPSFVVSVIIC